MKTLEVQISAGDARLVGDLAIPDAPLGVVLFAHGSGSGRLSSRNRFVADALQRAGLATLLIDLLSEQEERTERLTAHLRFDIPLLAGRLVAAMRWLAASEDLNPLPLGLFGASTGAAAAIVAATRAPVEVAAIVSRGGRPDLAAGALEADLPPVLLIVGTHDPVVMDLNRNALHRMGGAPHALVEVPGASHLFEEPGTLEEVARLASEWFVSRFGTAPQA